MKKVLLALVLVCVLCAASIFALADSWDFLHSAIRVATPEILEKLAAEQGFELYGWGEEGDYSAVDFSLEGIPCDSANLYNFSSEPTYACVLYFSASDEGTAGQPGEAFETLSAALVSRYGEPAFSETGSEEIVLNWYFEDASVAFSWIAGTPPTMYLSMYGSSIMGDTKFPFAPTGIAAEPATSASIHGAPQASSAEPFSFRNRIAGGMTVEAAIAAEGRAPDAREADSVRYDEEPVAGFSASLTYRFQNGKLASASYAFETQGALDLSNTENFAAINAGLASKYGASATDEALWRDDLFQDNPSALAMAVAVGHLAYHSSWIVQDAVIDHTLSSEDNQILHMLAYTFTVPQGAVPDTTGL